MLILVLVITCVLCSGPRKFALPLKGNSFADDVQGSSSGAASRRQGSFLKSMFSRLHGLSEYIVGGGSASQKSL